MGASHRVFRRKIDNHFQMTEFRQIPTVLVCLFVYGQKQIQSFFTVAGL
jgi:hypothetical protein